MTTDLALVPGLPNTVAVFDDVRPLLPPEVKVHVLDNPQSTSVDSIAAFWLQRLPNRFWLCGYSFGAHIALAILAAARDRVQGISLVCGSPYADDPAAAPRRAASLEAVESGRYFELARSQVPHVFHPSRVAALTPRLWRMVEEYGPEKYADHVRAMASRPDRSGLLDGTLPTMLVGASHDAVLPADVMRKIVRAIPHQRVEIVEDCGHLLPFERPDALARLLTEWMQAPS